MEYVLLFLEGMITFISPCILPMFPLYLSYFSGKNEESSRSRAETFLNVAGFILGFTVVFTLIGSMVGTLGAWIKEYQSLANFVSGLVVTVFGLNYAGFFKIHFLEKSRRIDLEIQTFRFFSSLLFGMIFAIGWTPCVGTFLGSALMIAVQSGSTAKGAGMLFVFSMGLGVPFALCGIFLDSLRETFSFFKRHYGVINKVSGIILIITGISMMSGTFYQLLSISTGGAI